MVKQPVWAKYFIVTLIMPLGMAGMVFSAPVNDCQCCCCAGGPDHGHARMQSSTMPMPAKCAQCVQAKDPLPSPPGEVPSRPQVSNPPDCQWPLTTLDIVPLNKKFSTMFSMDSSFGGTPATPLYLLKSSLLC